MSQPNGHDSTLNPAIDLNIVTNQCDYPRYITSGLLFNKSIEKTKHIIYKNKYLAHRDQSPYPEHVTVVFNNVRGYRPWYSMHQCIGVNCPIHPEKQRLTNVTETKTNAKLKDGTPGFRCSYLLDKSTIDLYPFYKRSIECYNSSFEQSYVKNVVKHIDTGVWHDPYCKQCDTEGMHFDVAEFTYDTNEIDTGDISDLFYKYRFIFDPDYIIGNNKVDSKCLRDRRVGILQQSTTPTAAQCQSSSFKESSPRTSTACRNSTTPKEKCLSNRVQQINYSPDKRFVTSRSQFSRPQTPIKSPYPNRSTHHNSARTHHPYYHPPPVPPAAAAQYQSSNYSRPTTHRQTTPNRVSPYRPALLHNWQTFTPPQQQYHSPLAGRTRHVSCPSNQSGYYGNYSGPHTPVMDARLDHASGSPGTISPYTWTGDMKYYNHQYPWSYSPWYPNYSPTQYSQPLYAPSTYQDSPYANNYGMNAYFQGRGTYKIGNDADNLGNDTYYHSNETNYDDEDPFKPVVSTERPMDESVSESTDRANSGRSCHYSTSPTRSRNRSGRHESGSRCHEGQGQSEREPKRKRSPSGSRRSTSRSRHHTTRDSRHASHTSSRSQQRRSGSKSTSSQRDPSPHRPSRPSRNRKQSSDEQTSRSRRRALAKSSSRERSPKTRSVASTVKLVRHGHKK